MTSIALTQRTPRTRVLSVLLAVGALALSAQFALPIPGTPVPLTLQPFVVVLTGLMLGPLDAALAMVAYLIAGSVGLPVFAPMGAPGIARLIGPTGGYLLSYPVAAAMAGWLGARSPSFVTRALAAEAGMLVLYVGGLAQLSLLIGNLGTAAVVGVLPFIAADAVKALVAAALAGIRRNSV